MFKLSIEKFFEYLKDGCDFEIQIGDKPFKITKDISIIFDEKNFQGFTEKIGFCFNNKHYKTDKGFLKALKNTGVTDTVNVIKINDFSTLKEYEENIEFQNADMQYLLNKYRDCNYFVLCAYYGENKLDKTQAEYAMESLIKDDRNYTLKVYDKLKEQYNLKDYEILYNEIKKECENFGKKNRDKYLKKYGFFQNSFICDHVGKDTKYSEPTALFWHFYHMLGNEVDVREQLNKLTELKQDFRITDILDKEEYKPLKKYLVDVNITFTTHCTGGPLSAEFKFILNEDTKKWLLTHKNDYDFNGDLEDLAFYFNDKLKFSSCTHEGFHNDIK